MNALDYLSERLKEASTMRGIILLLGAIGVKIDPSQYQDILAVVLFAVGIFGIFLPDAGKGGKDVANTTDK